MSSTSPAKCRGILVNKNVNFKSNMLLDKGANFQGSPKKANLEQESIPVNLKLSSASSDITLSNGFVFYEETMEERATILMNQISLSKRQVQDENDYERMKENISQELNGKKVKKARRRFKKQALRDLSIDEYAGYIQYSNSNTTSQLTLHMGYPTKIPCFITPPRNGHIKEFFSANDCHKNKRHIITSQTAEDICKEKVVKKLAFLIHQNSN
ncbi:HCR014Cp [Eremothecium sinecaudum]|uniref:HCR014Cp n=1 Tax=Eremothecium sinecaudum TaxID=45286 RepID=A0A0X8HRK5_9SACH|nr:HCR014Cp [Eremothecium sinecaudum]AMD20164.1 HCR014Cp [Eremothecium sinecaudum]